MAGLVSYASSDEEGDIHQKSTQTVNISHTRQSTLSMNNSMNGTKAEIQSNGATTQPEPDAPLVGPALGPPTTDIQMADGPEEEDAIVTQSPYSANRAFLRDLTLPTVPNYEIPPSPPGSPVASTNAKFKHFLELKKQGIHFNDKLAKSSALKNPSLMQKLMDFSDIDEAGQYATTLSVDLWNPKAFPEYAYKEELAKSQQKITKRKEEEKLRGPRERVDFVSATVTEPSSRSGTPVAAGRGVQKSSTAKRVMAGLDRGRSSSPQVAGVKRKTRFDAEERQSAKGA